MQVFQFVQPGDAGVRHIDLRQATIMSQPFLAAGHAQQLAVEPRVPVPVETLRQKHRIERGAMQILGLGQRAIDIEDQRLKLHGSTRARFALPGEWR